MEKTRLLVVDPSHKTGEMELMKRDHLKQTQVPVLKKIRILQSTLKAKQYQMVCVEEGFVDNQLEYEVNFVCLFVLFFIIIIIIILLRNKSILYNPNILSLTQAGKLLTFEVPKY